MTDISKRLEQTLRSAIQKNPILPVKVADGILVGDVKITSEGSLKFLWQHGEIKYKEISLNCAAISLANLLARRKNVILQDNIYNADQEYGRWFVDSQLLRSQYQLATNNRDYDKADVLWAKYTESRNRTDKTKIIAERLSSF
jgi:hypothetical protein